MAMHQVVGGVSLSSLAGTQAAVMVVVVAAAAAAAVAAGAPDGRLVQLLEQLFDDVSGAAHGS